MKIHIYIICSKCSNLFLHCSLGNLSAGPYVQGFLSPFQTPFVFVKWPYTFTEQINIYIICNTINVLISYLFTAWSTFLVVPMCKVSYDTPVMIKPAKIGYPMHLKWRGITVLTLPTVDRGLYHILWVPTVSPPPLQARGRGKQEPVLQVQVPCGLQR